MSLDLSAFYDVVPSGRLADWTVVGVPGGIPYYGTMFADITQAPYNAVSNSGSTASDQRTAIQSALNACPTGQYVYAPSGYYRCSGQINIPSGVVLRGAGTGSVFIPAFSSTAGLFSFGSNDLNSAVSGYSTGILAGSVQGSTQILLQSSAGITSGSLLVITELNNPSYVQLSGTSNASAATWVDGWVTAGSRARGQIVAVTSFTGNVVNFTPALYTGYTTAPLASRYQPECTWAGIENLQIYAINAGDQSRNVFFKKAAYCWVSGIWSNFSDGDHVTLDWSYRNEVRHNYIHDAYQHTAGNYDTMIGLRYKSSCNLIIDNILERMHVSVMCEWGAAGNVIAYNLCLGNYDDSAGGGTRWLPPCITTNHGAHPQYNLFEGNIVQRIEADAYWGTSSHATIFRNYATGIGWTYPPYSTRGTPGTSVFLNQADRCIDIWELQSSHNIVGNVLGNAFWTGTNDVRKVNNPTNRNYAGNTYALTYGYPGEASAGGTAQANPSGTIIETSNWDFSSGVVYDPNITDHAIPDSLFLPAKPTFFGALNWPPIDPITASGKLTSASIPAGWRYAFGDDPPMTSGQVAIMYRRLGRYLKLYGLAG